MQRIAKFKFVSLTEFLSAYPEQDAEAVYSEIKAPRRATSGSAGYDFFAPFEIELAPGESIKVPTGIRAEISEGWVLQIYPRSGLGFRFRLMLNNTVGVIDSDYFHSDNEGHIMIKLCNAGDKAVTIPKGGAFAQGIFLPFGITTDDAVEEKRNGGFGSTSSFTKGN